MMELKDSIKKLASELQPQLVKWRRYMHANPELSFAEYKTMDFITSVLDELGVELSLIHI